MTLKSLLKGCLWAFVPIGGKDNPVGGDKFQNNNNRQQTPNGLFERLFIFTHRGVTQAPKESQVSAGITPSITNVPVDTFEWLSNLLILLKGDLSWRRA